MVKQLSEKGLAKSQTRTSRDALALPGPRLAPPLVKPPPPAEFPERRDDPAQAEELERQQDA